MTTATPPVDLALARSARAGGRAATGLVVLGLLILAGLVVSVSVGAVPVSLDELLGVLRGHGVEPAASIVLQARLPRALCAGIAGCNLAIAGVLLQGVTRNPLADPGLVGVTAGAALAATIVLAAVPGAAVSLPIVAFAGAMGSTVFVYGVSWRPGLGSSPVRMVLAGVAVNAFLGAVIGLLMTAFAERVPSVVLWTIGSFNGRAWPHVGLLLPYTAAGLALAALLARPVRLLELGDDSAATMGVAVERTRLLAFAAAALLAGSAASVAGMVGFVGLVVPHLVRLVIGSNRLLLPASALAGSALLLWSDLAARTVLAPAELPVGVITGLIGGPYFVFLLCRSGWLK